MWPVNVSFDSYLYVIRYESIWTGYKYYHTYYFDWYDDKFNINFYGGICALKNLFAWNEVDYVYDYVYYVLWWRFNTYIYFG